MVGGWGGGGVIGMSRVWSFMDVVVAVVECAEWFLRCLTVDDDERLAGLVVNGYEK